MLSKALRRASVAPAHGGNFVESQPSTPVHSVNASKQPSFAMFAEKNLSEDSSSPQNRRSAMKGQEITDEHEHYALVYGMMLGLFFLFFKIVNI